jgi:hypothetical protein
MFRNNLNFAAYICWTIIVCCILCNAILGFHYGFPNTAKQIFGWDVEQQFGSKFENYWDSSDDWTFNRYYNCN